MLEAPWGLLHTEELIQIASLVLAKAKTACEFHYRLLNSMETLMQNNVGFKSWFEFCNLMIAYGDLQAHDYQLLSCTVLNSLHREDSEGLECVCLVAQLLVQKTCNSELANVLLRTSLALEGTVIDSIRPKLLGVALSYLASHGPVEAELSLENVIYSTPYEVKLLTVGLCTLPPTLERIVVLIRNLHTLFLSQDESAEEPSEISTSEILTDKLMSALHNIDEYSHFRSYALKHSHSVTELLPLLDAELQGQLRKLLELQRVPDTGLIRRWAKPRKSQSDFMFS
jgi:hypothetical protein